MSAKITGKTYLVGGAVRDELLERRVTERDWVVVGSSPSAMIAAGFTQVGKDFPVFLHPQTKEEYALARTERKVGKGYTGFTCDASQSVTLEDDLLRRDLTINAIAKSADGTIVDPYNGRADIAARTLRHVSPAFVEDPLRILRVARFCARFAYLGFTVASETLALMQTIAAANELNLLPAERVWRETEKALNEANPHHFFAVLAQAKATESWFAPLYPQILQDTIKRLMEGCASANWEDAVTAQCTLLALTLPANHTQQWLTSIRAPKHVQKAAELVDKTRYFDWLQPLQPEALLALFDSADVWRREAQFTDLVNVLGIFFVDQEAKWPTNQQHIMAALAQAKRVSAKELAASGLSGLEIKAALAQKRLTSIGEALNLC